MIAMAVYDCVSSMIASMIAMIVLEQTAIATVLSDMDAEIEQLGKRLVKTRNLKQGMMQQLLTGKIRLVNPPGKSLVNG